MVIQVMHEIRSKNFMLTLTFRLRCSFEPFERKYVMENVNTPTHFISGDSDVTFFGNRPLPPEHRMGLIFEISCAQNFHKATEICPKKRVFWHFSASQSTQQKIFYLK